MTTRPMSRSNRTGPASWCPSLRSRLSLAALLLITVSTLAGCAAHRTVSLAREEERREHWDLAVIEYAKALSLDPGDPTIKIAFQRSKFIASQEHFKKGKAYRSSGNLELALVELQMAVALDSNNSYALGELAKAQKDKDEIDRLGRQKTPIERLKEVAKGARVQPPLLNPKSQDPITIVFSKETSIKDIYTAVAKAAGINVLFDPQMKDEKITVELKDVSLKKGLEILMRQVNHFYKVLDEETIIIAADTPQNRKDYEDLVIKTFFLSSGDVKEVMNVLRTLIEARRIAMNPQLNAIVIRDTVDKVAVAERIVEANDKAKAEVIIDIELLQVTSSHLKDMGVEMNMALSQSLTPNSGVATDPWHWNDIVNIGAGNWLFGGLPSFSYTFLKNNGDATLLAKPQLRITEGEKATLTIGDRVPIPTTTFNTSGTIGGNIVPITSFQYQDVGIKIDMEPRVHHNREVTLKLTIEVSQLGDRIPIGNGQTQPSIGTRTITSIIRLKDGESNFLAGLLRTDKQHTENGIPFLMDIPVIGKLFSRQTDTEQRKDLLLTLTPHIIRVPDITEEDLLPIWVGTENNVTFQGTSSRIESPAQETPFDERRPLQQQQQQGPKSPRSALGAAGGMPGPGNFGLQGAGTHGGKDIKRPNNSAGDPRDSGAPLTGPGTGDVPPTAPVQTPSGGGADPETAGGTEPKRSVALEEAPSASAETPAPRYAAPPVAVLRIELPDRVPVEKDFSATIVLDNAEPGSRFQANLLYDLLDLDLSGIDTSGAVFGAEGKISVDRSPGALRFDWTVGDASPEERPIGHDNRARIELHFRPRQQKSTQILWSGGLGLSKTGRSVSVAMSPAEVRIVDGGQGNP